MELLPVLRQRFWDSSDASLAGGKLYSYEAGTSTPKATYQDRDGLVPNTNPIILDSTGYADVWIGSGYYKFVLKDSSDNILWTEDDISLPSEAALAASFWRGVTYITSANSPYTITQDDNGHLISVDATSGAVIVNMAEISSLSLPFNVGVKLSNATNTCTINRAGTDLIDTSTSKLLETVNATTQLIADISTSPDKWAVVDIGVTPDGSITRAKLATGAVAKQTVRSVTTTDTATTSDDVLLLSGASFTETLPTAVGNSGKILTLIHNGTSLTQIYTLQTSGVQTIGGVAGGSYVLYTNGETLRVVSDGSNWIILDHKAATDWVDGGATTIGGVSVAPTKGTMNTDKFWWRRVGPEMFCRVIYKQTNASGAANGTGDYLMTMVGSQQFASSVTTFNSAISDVDTAGWVSAARGKCFVNAGNATDSGTNGAVIPYSSTQFRVMINNDYSNIKPWSSTNFGVATNAALEVAIEFSVPISGWRP